MSISEEAACSPGRLHVLTITPFYPTATDDANGCFVAEPLAALSRLGVVHTIFAVAPIYRRVIPIHSGVLPAQWVRYFALPGGVGLSSSGAFLFSRLLSRVRGLHTRMPIDVIHAHGPLPSGHAAMLLHRELAIPFVVSVHGLDAYSDRQVSGRPGEWCHRVSRLVFQSADRVVCMQRQCASRFCEDPSPQDLGNIQRGRSSASARPLSDDAARSSSPAPQQIVSIGNLIPTKGHDVLLKALAALSAKYPSLVCEIVGDGPLRERSGLWLRNYGLGNEFGFLAGGAELR